MVKKNYTVNVPIAHFERVARRTLSERIYHVHRYIEIIVGTDYRLPLSLVDGLCFFHPLLDLHQKASIVRMKCG